MSAIQCEAKIVKIGSWAVALLPVEASQRLSSRGMHIISGTLNNLPLQTALEPDGRGSHWFRVTDVILKAGNLSSGDTVKLDFTQSITIPEPDLPSDFTEALTKDTLAMQTWLKTTPKAKWEWMRWIRSTKNAVTRNKRIEVALDKLRKGLKRPCCFNSASCTEPEVCRNGVLIEEM